MRETKNLLHPEIHDDPPHAPISDGIDEAAVTSSLISSTQIAERAYALYAQRGCEDGHALDDWLQAERELLDERNR
jgi:hypothetical protein